VDNASQRTLAAEVRATAELYLEGKIDEWYSLENRPGVVLILNVTDIGAAQAVLEPLPLGKAHLMTLKLYPHVAGNGASRVTANID